MPRKTYDNKSDFDDEYSFGVESDGHPDSQTRSEVKLSYHRAALLPEHEKRATQFISILGIQPTDKVLIMGAGFGWTVEAMEAQGIVDVVGVDTSTYINNDLSSTEELDINTAITNVGLDPAIGEGLVLKNKLWDGGVKSRTGKGIRNENLGGAQSRNRIKQALGNKVPDIIITELLIESLEDAEILDHVSRLEAFSNSVVVAHFVLTSDVSSRIDLNMKTLAQWKSFLPDHIFIEESTFNTLL